MKDGKVSMEERINSLVNLLEQKNQDMVNLLEQKNQGHGQPFRTKQSRHVKIFAEMKAGLSSVNGIQKKLKEELKTSQLDSWNLNAQQTLAGFNKSAKNCMIAFNAHLNKSIQHVEPWHTIVFDAVVTNHGHAYSGNYWNIYSPTIRRVCVYVHILGSSRPMEVILRKNDHELVYLYSQGTGRFGSDDNMAVVDLAEGDGVVR
ncbi:hypothetical protein DPMN_104995 [Dreissena polymorpha]|uniref:C1q domain-containing protein n=1 Tax=Dreissena polymorpha TaxID=45954 RepID=A0A9D4K0J0_DREPO|nr:hypothetical protein DPMN_104995 [Dreissena polymorpha]